MVGTVRNLNRDKYYAFIRANGRDDYFFHKDDFTGDWHQMVTDYYSNSSITVKFEPTEGPKGLRAEKVERV